MLLVADVVAGHAVAVTFAAVALALFALLWFLLPVVSPTLTGRTPADGDWRHVTTRVAAVYGANASGRSTVLDAIDFFHSAVRMSATR